MTRLAIALEVTVTLADLGLQTYYFATEGFRTGAGDTPALTHFAEKIESIGEYRRELFSGARMAGATRASRGSIVLINDGSLDVFASLSAGGKVVARLGRVGDAYPSAWTDLFVSYVETAAADFSQLRLDLRDRIERLDAPVVTAMFSGAGGLEGASAINARKQLVFGQPGLVPLILLDPVKQIYFIQANATDSPLIAGISAFGLPFEGGVPITLGGICLNVDDIVNVQPAPGSYSICFGTYDGATASSQTRGPGFLRLGTPPIFDLRFGASGYLQNEAGTPPRAWRFTDLANRAGLYDVAPGTLAPMAGQTEDFSAGNRLVEGEQTYLAVMDDRAQALLGAYGFNRLDRFYCVRVLDPAEQANAADVSRFTFTQHNSSAFARTQVPGMENPAYQVNVKAGRAFKGSLAEGASAEMQDILTRDGFLTAFTGTCDAVRVRYPAAQSVSIAIDGHDFPDAGSQLRFVQRFGLLFGQPRYLITLTCHDFSAETLDLDLMDKVTLQLPRFGFDAGVDLRVVTVAHDYKARTIRFGLWGGNDGQSYEWALGGGGYPAGAGDPGGSNGGPVPPVSFITAATARDTFEPIGGDFAATISFGGLLESALDAMAGAFTGDVAAAAGDPDFASVALLLHFDGANGSTTITDSSSYADSKTSTSPIVLTTADSVWGGASLITPSGTSSGAAGATWAPGDARFARASGVAYTIECWFKKTGPNTQGTVAKLRILGGGGTWWDLMASSVTDRWTISVGGISTNFTVSTGVWHFCQTVVDTSNIATTKIDGTTVQTTSALSPWTGTPYVVLAPLLNVSSGDLLIDDLRITPGVARAFAVPTEAFPNS